ncbi:MAG TPA: cytochrome c oxidase assembly factor Coa1 family protein [Oleiagrimonas sp.]|nr:cytochrome c oxidase assembly factor Coa1 family protein [Oleiagrimonas sp.]
MPAEIARWNWGAFLLTWIWGIGNSTFIAFLCFVPFVNLVMPFVLGARGSEWAWRNKPWQSVEHFKDTQRKWSIAGLVVLIASIVFFTVFFVAVFFIATVAMENSGAYKTAVSQLKANPEIVQVLGRPISTGTPNGSFWTSNDSGKALFGFTVRGPKGEGKVAISARRTNGTWHLTQAIFRDSGSGRVIHFGEHANRWPGDDRKPAHRDGILTHTRWNNEGRKPMHPYRHVTTVTAAGLARTP